MTIFAFRLRKLQRATVVALFAHPLSPPEKRATALWYRELYATEPPLVCYACASHGRGSCNEELPGIPTECAYNVQ